MDSFDLFGKIKDNLREAMEVLVEHCKIEFDDKMTKGEFVESMVETIAWYYIRHRGKEREVDVGAFASDCLSCIMAGYMAFQGTVKDIEEDLKSGRLGEKEAEIAKMVVHIQAAKAIEDEVEKSMLKNGNGKSLKEVGGIKEVEFESVMKAFEDLAKIAGVDEEADAEANDNANDNARADSDVDMEAALKQSEESLRSGEGKDLYTNMGYVQLVFDTNTMNMGMVPLHVYKHFRRGTEAGMVEEAGPEEGGEDEDEVCDYAYFVPKDVNKEGLSNLQEDETPDHEYLNEDSGMGIQTVSRYQDVVYEGHFTNKGDKEETKFVRDHVRMFEEAYYNCELLKKGGQVMTLFRIRNLYGGILDDDEVLEEIMRAFKSLKGNIMMRMLDEGIEDKEMYEVFDNSLDEELFEKAARANIGELVEAQKNMEERWF